LQIQQRIERVTKDQIEIVQAPSCLIVRGKLKEQPGKTYLHRGIANGVFERHFELADYVEVTDATMGEGLLVVDLKREVPEALKPKSIPINNFVPGRRMRAPLSAVPMTGHEDRFTHATSAPCTCSPSAFHSG
jgi:molecular chaperone IbpA